MTPFARVSAKHLLRSCNFIPVWRMVDMVEVDWLEMHWAAATTRVVATILEVTSVLPRRGTSPFWSL